MATITLKIEGIDENTTLADAMDAISVIEDTLKGIGLKSVSASADDSSIHISKKYNENTRK